MITRTQWKPLDARGIVPFTVNKSITLDLYTCDKDKEGTKQTFMKDSKFEGQLVRARISKRLLNGAFVPHTETSGLMVATPDKSGYYLIPTSVAQPIEEVEMDETISPMNKSLTSDIQTKLTDINENTEKKYFGFTVKQLLVIGVALLIVRKL
jgi:hypothetical protein